MNKDIILDNNNNNNNNNNNKRNDLMNILPVNINKNGIITGVKGKTEETLRGRGLESKTIEKVKFITVDNNKGDIIYSGDIKVSNHSSNNSIKEDGPVERSVEWSEICKVLSC